MGRGDIIKLIETNNTHIYTSKNLAADLNVTPSTLANPLIKIRKWGEVNYELITGGRPHFYLYWSKQCKTQKINKLQNHCNNCNRKTQHIAINGERICTYCMTKN